MVRQLVFALALCGSLPVAARHGHAVRGLAAAGARASASTAAGAGPGAGAITHLAPELDEDFPALMRTRDGKDQMEVKDQPEQTQGRHKAKKSKEGREHDGHWCHAFLKAFFVVSIAELFDKTWFMSLILALKLGWKMALTGGYTGLALHCVLSALLGFGFSHLLKPSILHFITAGLFFFFTLLYAKDWYYAEPDSDLIASGKEEAAEAMGDGEAETSEVQNADDTPEVNTDFAPKKRAKAPSQWKQLAQAFLAVFIAEWGDRTQMAMIGLHSSLPVIPVFVGSALAFLALTVSAVVVASFIAKAKLSERLVMGTASFSFLVFAILALLDGLRAKAHHE